MRYKKKTEHCCNLQLLCNWLPVYGAIMYHRYNLGRTCKKLDPMPKLPAVPKYSEKEDYNDMIALFVTTGKVKNIYIY